MKLYAIQNIETGAILLTATDLGFVQESLMDLYTEMAYDNYCYNVLWCNTEKHKVSYDNIENINNCWEDAYWYNFGTYDIIDLSDTCADLSEEKVIPEVFTNIYDKTTKFTNCVVEIRQNTTTGEMSIGWVKTPDSEEITEENCECIS